MLVVSNGAPKSGSTWLFNILREMKDYATPPEEFLLDKENVNTEIKYDRLDSFLREVDYSSTNYLLKNHFGKAEERDLLLSSSDVAILNITRDLKDVTVSAYHHRRHKFPDFDRSFEHFYWVRGRYTADLVRSYHETWNQTSDAKVFVASYEGLKSNFDAEVQRMGRFLGLELSRQDITRIRESTSMDSLREKYKDDGERKFFRKGVVGDWTNYISGPILKDIEGIERAGIAGLGFYRKNLGLLLKRYYELRYGPL